MTIKFFNSIVFKVPFFCLFVCFKTEALHCDNLYDFTSVSRLFLLYISVRPVMYYVTARLCGGWRGVVLTEAPDGALAGTQVSIKWVWSRQQMSLQQTEAGRTLQLGVWRDFNEHDDSLSRLWISLVVIIRDYLPSSTSSSHHWWS